MDRKFRCLDPQLQYTSGPYLYAGSLYMGSVYSKAYKGAGEGVAQK